MKAFSPMLVTGLPSIVAGIVSAPDAFLSQPVIVTESLVILYFKLGSISSFSPHPPRSRGSDMTSRIKGTGFMVSRKFS